MAGRYQGALAGVDVAAFLHGAGFSGESLITAVAIARAESGWIPERRGGPNSDGTYDWGLMQINDSNHPTEAEKTQPLANARKAYSLYKGRGGKFTDWAAFNNGAYKAHMDIARQSVKALQNAGPDYERKIVAGQKVNEVPIKGTVPITQGIDVHNPLDGIGASLDNFSKTFNKIAGNTTAVIIGVVLLVLGVVILLRSTGMKMAADSLTGGIASKAAGAVGKD